MERIFIDGVLNNLHALSFLSFSFRFGWYAFCQSCPDAFHIKYSLFALIGEKKKVALDTKLLQASPLSITMLKYFADPLQS